MLSGRVASISISLLFTLALLQDARSQSWPHNSASFLEPNRFGLVGDVSDSYLWLEAGFGRDVVGGPVKFGLEGLIWSRLRSLSGFRFPVETADYFFGVYSTFDIARARYRVRLSHISAHLVDGADTIVGGSSSRFSREFVSLERFFYYPRIFSGISGALGFKYVFHQVTPVEPSFQIPISVNLGLVGWGSTPTTNENTPAVGKLMLTLSGDAGPSWPAFSAGITARSAFSTSANLDVFGRYYHGLSRAGIEGKKQARQVEIGVHVIPFENFD